MNKVDRMLADCERYANSKQDVIHNMTNEELDAEIELLEGLLGLPHGVSVEEVRRRIKDLRDNMTPNELIKVNIK